MKKTNVILLTLLLGAAASLLPACNKQKPQDRSINNPSASYSSTFQGSSFRITSEILINPDSVGYFHNKALELTVSTWESGNFLMYDLLEHMSSEMSAQFSEFSELSSSEIQAILNDPDVANFISHLDDSPNEINSFFQLYLYEQKDNEIISEYLHDKLVDVFDVNLNYSQIMSALEEVNQGLLTDNDLNFYKACSSTLVSSYEFWTIWDELNPPLARMSNNQKVILCDAIAGAGFFAAGPLGILIAGVISAGVSE